MTDYIAYQGKVYQIEWYYTTNDLSQAYEYADQMSPQDKAKLIHLLVRMGDLGKIFDETKFRNEGDSIYTFKPKPHRFLCFFYEGGKIIITNAFWKKQDKLPQNEKTKALESKADYHKRVQEGTYYED